MRRSFIALVFSVSVLGGCDSGDSADSPDDDAGQAGDASADGDAGLGDGADAGDGGQAPAPIALDTELDADAAAAALCGLAPYALGTLTAAELPVGKITNTLRDEQAVFVDDKPPICADADDSSEDLCVEDPTEAVTYAFLYRDDAAAASDPVDQVWCKSDNFQDLALIPGAEAAALGECEALHDYVVAWAMAQAGDSSDTSKRGFRYKASIAQTGGLWVAAEVETRENGDTLVVDSPELYVAERESYIEDNGTAALGFLDDDFFGNHYCKVISPARALEWLKGD